jgi:hypothetical protein
MDDQRSPSRKAAFEALVVAASVALAYLVLRTAPALAAGAFMDDGVYLSLGKALADGDGYRSVYAAGAPVHMKYPPGLPLVYALLWSVRDDLTFVHTAALLLSLLATSATAGILWWIARGRLALPWTLAAGFVIGPFLLEGSVQYFNLAVSEPWFMLGWAWCLLLMPPAHERSRRAIVVGLLAGITTLFRTQAVVLLPALAAAVWLRSKSWIRSASLLAAGIAPLVLWSLLHGAQVAAGPITTQPDEAAYASWAPESVGEGVVLVGEILRSQAGRYWTALPLHLASWVWLGAALWLLVAVGWGIGTVKRFRDEPATALSVLAVGGVVLLWPYAQDRFVLALLPFAGLMAASGYHTLARTPRFSVGYARATLAAGALLVAAIVASRQAQIRGLAANEQPGETTFYFHPAQFLPNNTEFVITASRWIATGAAPDDRLLTPLPSALWLYTGRAGVNATPSEPNVGPSAFDEPGRFLARRVIEDDVTLLILWNPRFLVTRDAALVQQTCPEALEFLDRTAAPTAIVIFRVRRDDPCFDARFLEPARAEIRAAASATS